MCLYCILNWKIQNYVTKMYSNWYWFSLKNLCSKIFYVFVMCFLDETNNSRRINLYFNNDKLIDNNRHQWNSVHLICKHIPSDKCHVQKFEIIQNSMQVHGYPIKINSELNLSLLITLNGSQNSACRSLYKFFLVKESKVNA